MQLKVLLPSGPFTCVEDVTRIVVMTPGGAFGLLPHRLDCAAVLSPGLLSYSTAALGEIHLAVDTGLMIKTGTQVLVCVRHAVAGADLGQLREAVDREMLQLGQQEQASRRTMARLEVGLVRRLVELQRA
jgi:F-type H+-transporting ATPase subunit epsilon